MNIHKIDVTAGRITILCTSAAHATPVEREHVLADCTIIGGDQDVLMTDACGIDGCGRVTSIPRQRPTDDPIHWQTEHNRAMNVAVKTAIGKGAAIAARTPAADRSRLLGEKGKNPKRFAAEEWKDFGAGTVRVKSVREEFPPEDLA